MSKMTEEEKLELTHKVGKHIALAAGEITEDMEILLSAFAHTFAVAGVSCEKNKNHLISYVVHVIDEVYEAQRRADEEEVQ